MILVTYVASNMLDLYGNIFSLLEILIWLIKLHPSKAWAPIDSIDGTITNGLSSTYNKPVQSLKAASPIVLIPLLKSTDAIELHPSKALSPINFISELKTKCLIPVQCQKALVPIFSILPPLKSKSFSFGQLLNALSFISVILVGISTASSSFISMQVHLSI